MVRQGLRCVEFYSVCRVLSVSRPGRNGKDSARPIPPSPQAGRRNSVVPCSRKDEKSARPERELRGSRFAPCWEVYFAASLGLFATACATILGFAWRASLDGLLRFGSARGHGRPGRRRDRGSASAALCTWTSICPMLRRPKIAGWGANGQHLSTLLPASKDRIEAAQLPAPS